MAHEFSFKQTIQQLHNDRDWRERTEAVKKLTVLGTEEAMQAILSALYHESQDVVRDAASGLRVFGSRAIPGLLEVLYAAQKSSTQATILLTLGGFGDTDLIPHFIHFLHHENTNLRFSAVRALENNPDERAVFALIEALKQPDNSSLRVFIARMLMNTGSLEATTALMPFLLDENPYMRSYAALAVGRLHTDEGLRVLLSTSHHARPEIRSSAAEGLGANNSDAAYQRLLEMLKEKAATTEATLQDAIYMAIGSTQRDEAVSLLLKEHNQMGPEATPRSLYEALALTAQPHVIAVLMEDYRRNQRKGYVASKTLHSFAHHYFNNEDAKAIHQAMEGLNSSDQRVRLTAVWRLNAFSHEQYMQQADVKTRSDLPVAQVLKEIESHLISLLDDHNPDIRLSVIEGLRGMLDQHTIQRLYANIEDADPLVAQKAMIAIIRHSKNTDEIIQATASEYSQVRCASIEELGFMRLETTFPLLLSSLDHVDPETRFHAANALGRMGNTGAVPNLLEKLTIETDPKILQAVVKALNDLQDPRTNEPLIHFLRNTLAQDKPNEDLVSTVLRAIKDTGTHPDHYNLVVVAFELLTTEGTNVKKLLRLQPFYSHTDERIRSVAGLYTDILGNMWD
jgi:HEAT repeat protein